MLENQFKLIKIKKRTLQEWFVLIFFMMPLILAFLTEFLGLTSSVRYLMDVILICLGVLLYFRKQITIPQKLKPLFLLVIVFFVYSLITYFFNYQSIFYFLWGTRNTFRFYLAFLIFVSYVSQAEAETWLKFLDIIFWINLAIAIYQFAVLKVHQDLLGGIFGVNASANGYMLVFFCIVIGRSLLKTFDGNESYVYCALKCAASLVIAAMAEMKFYYFAFVLILVVAACLTRFTKEKIVFLILAFVIVVAAASLLTFWYSEFDNFFSLESLFELATKENYSSENDINRLSAISVMMDKYIVEPGQQIFGKGLGNCDGSDVSIFNSPFYQNYSFLHYSWFAFVMIFLETGFVGLGLFLAFFVLCAVYSRKQLKNNTGNRLFCQLGILMAILSIVIAFYNASLRIEAGYMVYFALALPFMINTEDENSQNISTD